MENIDNLINNFEKEVDKNIEFEHDINTFANELAAKLLLELDKEGIIASFYDTNFSFKFISKANNFKKLIFDVKMLDLDKYRQYARLSMAEQVKISVATFEHEGEYKLQDELAKTIVLLLFNHYGLQIKPEEEDDELIQMRN